MRLSGRYWTSLAFMLSALTLGLGGGCSGKQIDENDPAAMFQEAESDIKDGHYQVSIDKLRGVKNKFPYSKFAVDAQLRVADVFFMQESFAEAAIAYESFRDLHPKHEKVPYAMFRIGKSYFADAPGSVARDLSSVQKALDAMIEFKKKYPNSPEAKEASEMIVKSRELLAEKELYIGDFYYKREFFDSAKARYEKIIQTYPDTEQAKAANEKLAAIAKESGGKN